MCVYLYINIYNENITLKDDKGDFQSNPTCRLITPFKSQMGQISKIVFIALNINQWCSTEDYIKWFNNLEKNDKCSFIKYDLREFYPSITEKGVNEALKLAKEYNRISEAKMNIIKHRRKSLLFHNEGL